MNDKKIIYRDDSEFAVYSRDTGGKFTKNYGSFEKLAEWGLF